MKYATQRFLQLANAFVVGVAVCNNTNKKMIMISSFHLDQLEGASDVPLQEQQDVLEHVRSDRSHASMDDKLKAAPVQVQSMTRRISKKRKPSAKAKQSKARIVLHRNDKILQHSWGMSPVVIESHKLIFLTTPKISCTIFKQLFRRMMGFNDWQAHKDGLPHNPKINGLRYLSDYSLQQATRMLNAPDWTRAVFVRDPKRRMLSAYLHKAKANLGFNNIRPNLYLKEQCCQPYKLPKTFPGCGPVQPSDGRKPVMSFDDWVQKLVPRCPDHHWTPQYDQLPDNVWPAFTFIGRFEYLYNDTRQLLQQLTSSSGRNAWEEFGATGWGPNASHCIYDPTLGSTVSHGTSAGDRLRSFYNNSMTESLVEHYYKKDYNFEGFGFAPEKLSRLRAIDHPIAPAL